MPGETYTIDYSAPPGKINRDVDSIIAKLTKLDQLIEKTRGSLKTLGNDTPGLRKLVELLIKVDAELKSKVTAAANAEKALKEVGKDNRAITSMIGRLEKLEATLKETTAEAGVAAAVLAGVGSSGAAGIAAAGGVGSGGKGAAPGKGKSKAGMGGAAAGMAMMAGANLARLGLQEAAEGAQKGRDYFTASANKVAELRDEAREYASLRKQPGPNDQILREITGFMKETGVTPDDAVRFLTTYEGSATTGRDKGNIGGRVGQGGYTQAQQDALENRLKVVGGRFGMATGLDSRTAGDLTAVVSTYKRVNNESDLAGQLAGAHYGIDQGRGEISPLARSELGQAGSAIESGRVSGLPELGAFVGVASVVSKSPGSAGTTYGQVSRLLNETGADNEDQKAFIKESGMEAAKGDFNKLKALRDHLAKVKPEDANTYLESKGYGNSTDRRSILGMVGNVDVLEERIKKANEIAGNGKAALARLDANQKEISNVGNRARAEDFAVDVDAGIQTEKLQIGRTAALARLKDPNQPGGSRIYTPGTAAWDAMRTGLMMGSSTGEQERIDQEAIEGLIRGGKKVNVDVPTMFPGLMRTGLMRDAESDTTRREQFGKAFDLIESKGGDPFGGGAAQKLDQAGNLIKEAARDVARQDQGQGGNQAAPGPPPQGPSGAGAGFVPGRR